MFTCYSFCIAFASTTFLVNFNNEPYAETPHASPLDRVTFVYCFPFTARIKRHSGSHKIYRRHQDAEKELLLWTTQRCNPKLTIQRWRLKQTWPWRLKRDHCYRWHTGCLSSFDLPEKAFLTDKELCGLIQARQPKFLGWGLSSQSAYVPNSITVNSLSATQKQRLLTTSIHPSKPVLSNAFSAINSFDLVEIIHLSVTSNFNEDDMCSKHHCLSCLDENILPSIQETTTANISWTPMSRNP